MGKRRWILWQGLIAPSMERFIAARTESGFHLSGLILQAHQDAPYVARYSVEVDKAWRTRTVQVEVENDGQHRIVLATMVRATGGAMASHCRQRTTVLTSTSSGRRRRIRFLSGAWALRSARRNS